MTETDYCPETGDQPKDSLTERDLAALREIIGRIQGEPLRKHVLKAAIELLERKNVDLDHERWRVNRLKAEMATAQATLLAATTGRPMTVAEARACRVCRVCRGAFAPPFTFGFGDEYAHTACLGKTPDPAPPGADVAAAVAAERERCAAVAETTRAFFVYDGDQRKLDLETTAAKRMADAIVARIREGG